GAVERVLDRVVAHRGLHVAGDVDGAGVLAAVWQRGVGIAGGHAPGDAEVPGTRPVEAVVVDPREQVEGRLVLLRVVALERRRDRPGVRVGPGRRGIEERREVRLVERAKRDLSRRDLVVMQIY